MTNHPPDEKPLQTTSFVIHATRGVIRDQPMRRKAMFVLLVLVLAISVSGFTFLQSALDPHEHPWRVIIFALVCVWLTFTAVLLAIVDLLMVRLEARKAERALREAIAKAGNSPSAPNE